MSEVGSALVELHLLEPELIKQVGAHVGFRDGRHVFFQMFEHGELARPEGGACVRGSHPSGTHVHPPLSSPQNTSQNLAVFNLNPNPV